MNNIKDKVTVNLSGGIKNKVWGRSRSKVRIICMATSSYMWSAHHTIINCGWLIGMEFAP
jgi:hypothetical protein